MNLQEGWNKNNLQPNVPGGDCKEAWLNASVDSHCEREKTQRLKKKKILFVTLWNQTYNNPLKYLTNES